MADVDEEDCRIVANREQRLVTRQGVSRRRAAIDISWEVANGKGRSNGNGRAEENLQRAVPTTC